MYQLRRHGKGFDIIATDGRTVATAPVEADAQEIAAALNLARDLPEHFPGLAGDREDETGCLVEEEVDGGELVKFLAERCAWDEDGRSRAPA
jgi:hypothetical protein